MYSLLRLERIKEIMFVFSHLFCPLGDNYENKPSYQGSDIVQTGKEALIGNCGGLRRCSAFSLSAM